MTTPDLHEALVLLTAGTPQLQTQQDTVSTTIMHINAVRPWNLARATLAVVLLAGLYLDCCLAIAISRTLQRETGMNSHLGEACQ